MKFLIKERVENWIVTGFIGKNNSWFIGWSEKIKNTSKKTAKQEKK